MTRFSLFAALVLGAGFSSCAWADVLRMGYFSLPPHAYQVGGKGKPRGPMVDHFEKAAAAMGHTVEWVGPLPIGRLVEFLAQGQKIDGAVAAPKMFEKFALFPDQNVAVNRSILLVKKESKLEKITTIEDIKGLRIGFHEGAPLSAFLQDHVKDLKMTPLVSNERAEQGVQMLLAGRLDGINELNEYTPMFEAKLLKKDHLVKVVYLPNSDLKNYCVFSRKNPNAEKYIAQYNEYLKKSKYDPNDYDTAARAEMERK